MAYKDTVGNENRPDGICVLHEQSDKFHFACSWNGNTQIRIYPCPDPSGSGYAPARLSADNCDFSDFIVAAEAVRYFGQHRKLTFVSTVKDQGGFDESPAMRLWRTIHRAVTSNVHPEWREFTEGRNCHLPRPSKVGFVQGYLLEHNGKGVNEKMAPKVVLMLQKSARQSFEKKLMEQRDGYVHPGDNSAVDLEQYFANPDPLDPAKGHTVTIVPCDRSKTNFQGGIYDKPKDEDQSKQQQFSGYEIQFSQGPCPIDTAIIDANRTSWGNTLKYFSIGEQIALLRSSVAPEILMYAFEGTGLLPTDMTTSFPGTGTVASEPQKPAFSPPTEAAGGPTGYMSPTTPAPAQNAPTDQQLPPAIPKPTPAIPQPQPSAQPTQPTQTPAPEQQTPPTEASNAFPPQHVPSEAPATLGFPASETSGQPADATTLSPEAQQAKATLENLQGGFNETQQQA